MRLQNQVTNFVTVNQLPEDRAEKVQTEEVIETDTVTKTLETEHVKPEKTTPTFSEHVLFELIEKLEKETGFLVFVIQIKNNQSTTRLYDCDLRDRLPSTPDLLPDQIKSFMTVDDRPYGYSTKVGATPGEVGVTISLPEGVSQGEAKDGDTPVTIPTIFTLLVVTQHLPDPACFKQGPEAVLDYLNML